METVVQYIDMDDALKRLGGMKAVYISLLRKFLAGDTEQKMLEAFASGDAGEVRGMAHSLKGLAGNLSMPVLREAAMELETAAKNGEPFGELSGAVTDAWNKTASEAKKLLDGPQSV